jgi:hypothetical protein
MACKRMLWLIIRGQGTKKLESAKKLSARTFGSGALISLGSAAA